MDKKEKAQQILKKLETVYPSVKCALNHKNAFELLVATILSAQCTDKRVNIVTPVLFSNYSNPKSLAEADIEDVKEIIRSTGFYNNKAKNIIAASKKIVSDFGGNVPDKMEDLITLPGVARKTANVVLGEWFKTPYGIAVDTHVTRLSKLLGLSDKNDPVEIEKDLMRIFPKEKWTYISLALIQYGRDYCSAKKHDYSKCFLGGH